MNAVNRVWKFTIQQDQNSKHKAKTTEWLWDKSSEWPGITQVWTQLNYEQTQNETENLSKRIGQNVRIQD